MLCWQLASKEPARTLSANQTRTGPQPRRRFFSGGVLRRALLLHVALPAPSATHMHAATAGPKAAAVAAGPAPPAPSPGPAPSPPPPNLLWMRGVTDLQMYRTVLAGSFILTGQRSLRREYSPTLRVIGVRGSTITVCVRGPVCIWLCIWVKVCAPMYVRFKRIAQFIQSEGRGRRESILCTPRSVVAPISVSPYSTTTPVCAWAESK